MKNRISITLDSEIIKSVDSIVNGTIIKNRSHAIELLISKSLKNAPKKAVVLCGGKGTRLRPITYEIPKSMLTIKGKTILEHIIELYKRHNINDITLCVGYKKENIMKYFADGSQFGVKINYVEEKKPLGTAGPLRLMKNQIKTTFTVSNGDELKNIDIEKMYEVHKENNALVTIALTTVGNPENYGVARLNGSKIIEFIEKPEKNPPSKLINAGFYIIEPEVIDLIPNGFSMLEKDIFPKIASMGRLYGFPFSGQWFDTGNLERYEKAIKEWHGL